MAKANFSALTNIDRSTIKKPPVWPQGDYPGIIVGHKFDESAQKKTPFVRFEAKVTGWPDSVPEDQRSHDGEPIDLSKKKFYTDFYFGDAMWRLNEFLDKLGITTSNLEEAIPEVTGCTVLVPVVQKMSESDDEIYNPTRLDRFLID